MGPLKFLEMIADIIAGIKLLAKEWQVAADEEKVDAGLKEGDQRKVEAALGSPAGPSNPDDFPELQHRPRKKE